MFISEAEKVKIIDDFNKRNGIYSRLYDLKHRYGDGLGNPIGIMYRCISKIDNNRVIVLRYLFKSDNLTKQEFEEEKIKGMAIALKKADRYLKDCKKKNIQVDDCCEIECNPVNEKIVDSTNKSTREYFDVFMNRIQKYYKKQMKVIVVWC